jgi:hypothetical protein
MENQMIKHIAENLIHESIKKNHKLTKLLERMTKAYGYGYGVDGKAVSVRVLYGQKENNVVIRLQGCEETSWDCRMVEISVSIEDFLNAAPSSLVKALLNAIKKVLNYHMEKDPASIVVEI